MPKDERAREGYLSEMPVHETSCSLVPACNPARLQPRAPCPLPAAPRPTWPADSPVPTTCPLAEPPCSQRLKEYFVAQLQPHGVALCLVLADIYKVT